VGWLGGFPILLFCSTYAKVVRVMRYLLLKVVAFVGLLAACTWLTLEVGAALSTYMYSADQTLTF